MADDELVRQLQKSIEQLMEEVRLLKLQLAEKQDKFPMISPTPYPMPYVDTVTTAIPTNCRSCPNHPSNGGSGVCHCILGIQTTC